MWSIFGGAIEPGETPGIAVVREINEELSLSLDYRYLWKLERYSDFSRGIVWTWVFEARVDQVWDSHVLHEGQAAQPFAYRELPRERLTPAATIILERYHSTLR